MGIFKGIKEAEEGRFGRYILPGNYVVQIERCKEEQSRKSKGLVFFIAELLIIESDNEQRPAGTKMSWVVKMTQIEFPETALGNVKTFMNTGLASLGEAQGQEVPDLNSDDLSEEDAEELADSIAGEANILAGTFLTAEAFHKKTRANTDFTLVNWGVPQNLEELMKSAA